jgi:hypothetical protein
MPFELVGRVKKERAISNSESENRSRKKLSHRETRAYIGTGKRVTFATMDIQIMFKNKNNFNLNTSSNRNDGFF